jgi:hypothetical protein
MDTMIATQKQITARESRAAEIVRGRYDRVARFYDLEQAFEEPFVFGRPRTALWADAPTTGPNLEVGVGTPSACQLAVRGLAGTVH